MYPTTATGYKGEVPISACRRVSHDRRQISSALMVLKTSQSLRRSPKSLHTWKAQLSQPCKQIIETTEQAAEIRRLKKELARVSEERDILKKATAH
ncbi:MAG: transposase-like protein [Celeribacter sp.]|jgi:transposase-like protein